MVSNLKWRTGFGWSSLLLFITFMLVAFLFDGIVKGIFLVLAAFSGVWLIYRYYTYNGSPWRRVHFRGMLVYAMVAGEEHKRSQIEGRPFNIVNACRDMALLICGREKEIFVNAMIEELMKEKGDYFARLLESNIGKILPKVTDDQKSCIIENARKIDFGPELVMGNIIENTYGPAEAARYVVAVLTRQAY